MENYKFFIFLFFLIIIGVGLGVIFSFSSNSNNILAKNDSSHISNNPLLSYISGDSNSYENEEISGGSNNISGDSTILNTIVEHQKNIPSEIKAVYLTGWSAGTKSKRQSIIKNLNKYGFNAVVIDIKDEAGHLSYNSNVQTAIDISASKKMISDISAVIDEFHNADIYVIGRIVTFKDPTYAKKISENAYKKSDGTLWTDYSGNNWPNPYNTDSWEYPISLAKEAAELGFDEIQFDYIRFPSSEGKTKTIAYGFDSDTKTKSEAINSFLKKAMDELEEYNVVVSADVFGITTKKQGDFEHIGQDFYEISKIVDVICPMIYPSHYGYGEYGITTPDKEPYKIVKFALQDAQKQYTIASGDTKLAVIRPYLQDFTASWLKKGNYILYNTDAVTEQLQACYDVDIHDFTLWDPSNKYAYEALNNIVTKPSGDNINSGDIVTLDNTIY